MNSGCSLLGIPAWLARQLFAVLRDLAVILVHARDLMMRAARITAIHRRFADAQRELTWRGGLTRREVQDFACNLEAGNLREATQIIKRNTRDTKAFRKALRDATNADNEHDRLEAEGRLRRILAARNIPPPDESDETELVCCALPELITLERYERRALSRRKRAIRRFDALGE